MEISPEIQSELERLCAEFPHWEKTKDLIDQLLDVTLNYRQSGHPGGSRSKVHALVATLLSGAMRWDIRHPEKRFGDRFILVAGHTIPLIYCTLAVFNEALRVKYRQSGDLRYAVPNPEQRALVWEDLLGFRHRGGLPGHAEMSGKTLFLKFNTGPSGHGSPAAAGAALALKRAGAEGVKVFAFEGEGGLTTGVSFETMNAAWGLGLDNLYYVLDWNDFGIDAHTISAVVHGAPEDWFGAHGWHVYGAENGSDWEPVARAILTMTQTNHADGAPSVAWVKTRKGRGYLKYDNASHGTPHPMNSPSFWETKLPFAEKYGAQFTNLGGPAPQTEADLQREFRLNLQAVIEVLHRDQALVDYLAERLVSLGDSVPEQIPGFKLAGGSGLFTDERLYDYRGYPAELYLPPGSKAPNRAALGKWGAWVNAFGARHYNRPLFIACSADLAGSTNISGFAEAFGDFPGWGWFQRVGGPDGALLPSVITEFANAGMMAGMASVNFAADPQAEFDGFWGACSTYGSFSYLKYGAMRLFSQLAQDCELKVGKVLWIAGHSGPETAEDSRTHFGIFEPAVTQLFPQGSVIDLHPWEYNEVPVLLGAALKAEAPIVALHLTRPPIEIPDRERLGIPSHFEAARGAYIVRNLRPGLPHAGTLIVQGTSAMAAVVRLLPALDEAGLNVKIVCAASPQLFQLQPPEYRRAVITPADECNSTVISTQSRQAMHPWLFNAIGAEYALTADWDNRWRTGGTVDEVLEEGHLNPEWIMEGIRRFAQDRERRLERLREQLSAAG